ncbi:hypothetical protein JD844_023886 [Phrynosoma platyrhinos]|uniref:Uncharacterized protein n=1 Tax=Phrynosoma platyrhinos TaxID=52577 RepID=A0ABQ7SXK7_PHRPL|nr:hypothetical protein JD844_023886 [Phrynosoma platyrhinos]
MFTLQESVKWLPKSPKLHGSHNWNSQGSRWGSLKGKESTLYKFSSAKEKWKEGRISPEQEAEELEDPEEDEPISKFSGSLFDSTDNTQDQRSARVGLHQERPKVASKGKNLPTANKKQQVPAAATTNSLPTEGNRVSKDNKDQEATQAPLKITITVCSQMGSLGISIAGGKGSSSCKENDEGILIAHVSKDGPVELDGVQSKEEVLEDAVISEPSTPDSGPAEIPSKSGPFQTINHVITIPRIILTHPSTSDEDTDQLPQEPDDFEPEETENTEGHLYSDCLNNAFYPP